MFIAYMWMTSTKLFYILLILNSTCLAVRNPPLNIKKIPSLKTQTDLCLWNHTRESNLPYQSVTVECCDVELRKIMFHAINLLKKSTTEHLAEYIQRRVQLHYQSTFEVIVSEENFAISSYYHGPHSCKVFDHRYILVYETPEKHNLFDIPMEDFPVSNILDNSKKSGKKERRDYVYVDGYSTAEDDLSIQPPIDVILQFPNKFLLPDPKAALAREIEEAEKHADEETQKLTELLIDMTIQSMGNDTETAGVDEPELPNPTAISRNFTNLRKSEFIPENTHCERKKKDGNRCCNGRLAGTMRDAMLLMMTSTEFGKNKSESIIASEIQQRVQIRFEQSYEVIVSKADFVICTANHGDDFCKFENTGYFIAAYATPRQYDYEEDEEENKLASTMNPEPLGSWQNLFSNEEPFHHELKLYPSGERAGYPVGSHCTEKRTGSKCCSLIMFNAMKTAYDKHIVTEKFNEYDLRKICSAIQYNVEEVFQYSAEVIVSYNDFVWATHRNDTYICKYRVDRYYMLAYLTPLNEGLSENDSDGSRNGNDEYAELVEPTFTETQYSQQLQIRSHEIQNQVQQVPAPILMQYYLPQTYQLYQPMYHQSVYNQQPLLRVKRQLGESPYPPHSSLYNDIGSSVPFFCSPGLTSVEGWAGCDGRVQYEAKKTIDQERDKPNFNKHDTRTLAKELVRAVERRFGTTFESIVGEGDFTWKTNKFNERTSKIYTHGYNALTFQSSPRPPPQSDFIDIPNDPTLGGPTGETESTSPNVNNAANGNGNNAANGDFNGGADGGNGNANGFGNNQNGGNVPQNNIPQNNAPQENPPYYEERYPSWYDVAQENYENTIGWLANSCFSVDTWVTTPTGKKRMDELQIGDYVLTANEINTFFARIIFWIHREPTKLQQFVTVMTTYGKTLRLTAKHFMFRKKCGQNFDRYIEKLPADSEAVYAEKLRIDDCLIVVNGGRFEQQKIQDIYKTVRKGIYSPLTSNGRIIVNDMLGSCYSEVKQSTVQSTFFFAVDKLRKNILELFGNLSHGRIEIPALSTFGKDILQLVIPIRR